MFGFLRNGRQSRRVFIAEALLVAGILVFGGFALVSEGRLTPADLLAGFDQTLGR